MSEGPGVGLAAILDVTDAARPSPSDLVGLLRDLRDEHEYADETDWRNPQRRTLGDADAERCPRRRFPIAELDDVPLLATYRGEQIFTVEPVVALDPSPRRHLEGSTIRFSTLIEISGDCTRH